MVLRARVKEVTYPNGQADRQVTHNYFEVDKCNGDDLNGGVVAPQPLASYYCAKFDRSQKLLMNQRNRDDQPFIQYSIELHKCDERLRQDGDPECGPQE